MIGMMIRGDLMQEPLGGRGCWVSTSKIDQSNVLVGYYFDLLGLTNRDWDDDKEGPVACWIGWRLVVGSCHELQCICPYC